MERGQDDQRRLRRRNHGFESGASGGNAAICQRGKGWAGRFLLWRLLHWNSHIDLFWPPQSGQDLITQLQDLPYGAG